MKNILIHLMKFQQTILYLPENHYNYVFIISEGKNYWLLLKLKLIH